MTNLEKFVVAYDSKFDDSGAVLFLVNRAKIKNKWGSINLQDAKVFPSRAIAESVVKGMRFGNPRVLSLSDAYELYSQMESLMMNALNDYEGGGWDAHKDIF